MYTCFRYFHILGVILFLNLLKVLTQRLSLIFSIVDVNLSKLKLSSNKSLYGSSNIGLMLIYSVSSSEFSNFDVKWYKIIKNCNK